MDTFNIIKAMKTIKGKDIEIRGRMNRIYSDGSVSFTNKHTKKLSVTFGHNTHGYRSIRVGGRDALIHRLVASAFLSDYSEDMQVDHINGNRSDNRVENLRMVSHQQNQRGYRAPTSGAASRYRGVFWHKKNKKWTAAINHEKKLVHLGQFSFEIAAAVAYDRKATAIGYNDEALNQYNFPELKMLAGT